MNVKIQEKTNISQIKEIKEIKEIVCPILLKSTLNGLIILLSSIDGSKGIGKGTVLISGTNFSIGDFITIDIDNYEEYKGAIVLEDKIDTFNTDRPEKPEKPDQPIKPDFITEKQWKDYLIWINDKKLKIPSIPIFCAIPENATIYSWTLFCNFAHNNKISLSVKEKYFPLWISWHDGYNHTL